MAYEDDSFATRRIDRRTLIRRGIAFVGANALVPPAFLRAVFDEDSLPLTQASALTASRHVLVVLQLAGGNDGLNTVAPVGDPAYYDARPGLAIDAESALPLTSGFGLNPAMGGMKTLYDRGQVGIVLGVGYPEPNRSHFKSMDIWHTASMTEHNETGWIGRLLDATKHEQRSLWHAANIGQEEPTSLASRSSFVPSVGSVGGYALQVDRSYSGSEATKRTQGFVQLHARQAEAIAHQASYGGQLAFLSKTGLDAYQSTVDLKAAVGAYEAKVEYPTTPIASAFKTAAQLITSNLGTGICYVTTGGFDTHSNQANTQTRLLGDVSSALLAFYDDLQAQARAADVTTLAWTEFGRRIKENGSRGTDHGAAGSVFLVGGGVRPGLHGEQAPLTSTDGDVRYTTDFRSIYATLTEQRFGVHHRDVLGDSFPTLPLFA